MTGSRDGKIGKHDTKDLREEGCDEGDTYLAPTNLIGASVIFWLG
jgi:hypothetical protein